MIRRTGARIIPICQCEFDHLPSDSLDPYRKFTWWLVSPGLWLYAILVARRCNRLHQHTSVEGSVSLDIFPCTLSADVYSSVCIGSLVVACSNVDSASAGLVTSDVVPKQERVPVEDSPVS